MLDERKVIKIKRGNEDLELKADFKAFKKLNKLTKNAFLAINSFANDVDERLELLPVFIQAMAEEDLTIDEIENEILGLNYMAVMNMAEVVFALLNSELANEVPTETTTEVVEDESGKKPRAKKPKK